MQTQTPSSRANGRHVENGNEQIDAPSGLSRQQHHAPPSATALLASLKPSFFDTPSDLFDEKLEALSGITEGTDNLALLENLLHRIEEIDLARDVVTNSLANEVRQSSTNLLAGMRQVQDLDLDVTRTSLLVGALRRRLALAKENLFEAKLRVALLSNKRDELVLVRGLADKLVAANRIKKECDAVVEPLSARIEATLIAKNQLSTQFASLGLRAIQSTIDALSNRMIRLESTILSNVRESLQGPSLNKELFADCLTCFEKLGETPEDVFHILKHLWFVIIEETLSAPSVGKQAITKRSSVFVYKDSKGESKTMAFDQGRATENESGSSEAKRIFIRVSDGCSAYAMALDYIVDQYSLSKESVLSAKQESLGILARLTDEYLKSPLVRSQVLDEFAQTIEDASRVVDRADGWFAVTTEMESQYFNKTKMESSIRLRARVYAQQYQAEGFQAMRGLLWRESFVNVAASSSASDTTAKNPSADFVSAIFERLEIQPLFDNNEQSNPKTIDSVAGQSSRAARPVVITATMGSGLPRQVQRTLDLMRKLPISAAGEAFLGLLRIVDLYLLAVVATFVPLSRFFRSKKQMRTPGFIYMSQVKESLGEWLTSSPRHAAPVPPLSPTSSNLAVDITGVQSDDEFDIVRLCEFEFLNDPDRSFMYACVAAESFEFLLLVIRSLEKPLSELLPAVERGKLTAKMFVELPQVIKQIKSLVKRSAVERLESRCVFPELRYVYEGDTFDGGGGGPSDSQAQFVCFNDCVYEMQVLFQQLVTNPYLPEYSKVELWDDAVALFFEKFADAIADMPSCSAMDRGNMIMHLASFWEHLNQIPGSRAMLAKTGQGGSAVKAKAKTDDFIKAFYYDKPADLWDWMRRKKEDFEPRHFLSILETGLVGQMAGTTSYLTGEMAFEPLEDEKNCIKSLIGSWRVSMVDRLKRFDQLSPTMYLQSQFNHLEECLQWTTSNHSIRPLRRKIISAQIQIRSARAEHCSLT